MYIDKYIYIYMCILQNIPYRSHYSISDLNQVIRTRFELVGFHDVVIDLYVCVYVHIYIYVYICRQ